jgi:glucan phosphorylase
MEEKNGQLPKMKTTTNEEFRVIRDAQGNLKTNGIDVDRYAAQNFKNLIDHIVQVNKQKSVEQEKRDGFQEFLDQKKKQNLKVDHVHTKNEGAVSESSCRSSKNAASLKDSVEMSSHHLSSDYGNRQIVPIENPKLESSFFHSENNSIKK